MPYTPAKIAEEAIDMFLEQLEHLGFGFYDEDEALLDQAKAQAIVEIIEGCAEAAVLPSGDTMPNPNILANFHQTEKCRAVLAAVDAVDAAKTSSSNP